MTPKEIDEMQPGNSLDELVEVALGNSVINHLPFVYMEDWTEDGTDGWEGFVCPRCHSSNKESKCAKNYSTGYRHIYELLKWLLDNSGDLFIEYWQDGEWFLCNAPLSVRQGAILARSDKVADGELPNLPLALCRFVLKVALANEGK